MRILKGILMLCLALGLTAGYAAAQAAPPPAQQPPMGPKAEFLRNFNDPADKALRLLDAESQGVLDWRPGEGVRSAGEVYMHIAAANFSFMRQLGATLPPEIQLSANFDKSETEKAKIQAILKQSIELVRSTVAPMTDADFDKTIKLPNGTERTYRERLFALASHTHEHLGQSIAYARMNKLVPPWTEEAQQRQAAPPKKSN